MNNGNHWSKAHWKIAEDNVLEVIKSKQLSSIKEFTISTSSYNFIHILENVCENLDFLKISNNFFLNTSGNTVYALCSIIRRTKTVILGSRFQGHGIRNLLWNITNTLFIKVACKW